MERLNDKGFSLIELLIAVTILAVGLLAVAGLQVTAIKGNTHGNTISQATSLAEERIEEIRNMNYSAISFVPNPFPELNLGAPMGGAIYTRETFIEANEPMTNLKRVTVTVSWEANGPHQVVLRTIVANGGS